MNIQIIQPVSNFDIAIHSATKEAKRKYDEEYMLEGKLKLDHINIEVSDHEEPNYTYNFTFEKE